MTSSEYPDAVLEYVRDQGWNADLTEVQEGVYIVGGARKIENQTEKILVMAICEPEKKVRPQHINYLYKTGKEKEVDSISLTYTVNITKESREECKKYGINKIATETVRSQYKNSSFKTDPGEISLPDSGSSPQTNQTIDSGESKINHSEAESKDSKISDENRSGKHESLKINTILLAALALPTVYFTLAFIDGFMIGIGIIDEPTVIRTIANGINVIALAAAPISFHYDKKSIEKNSDWSPSSLFYIMIVPILNIVVSTYYIKKRKDRIGLFKDEPMQTAKNHNSNAKNKIGSDGGEDEDSYSTFEYSISVLVLIFLFSFTLFQWYYIFTNSILDSVFLFLLATSIYGRLMSGVPNKVASYNRWKLSRTIAGLLVSYSAFIFTWYYLAENNLVSAVFFFFASIVGVRYFNQNSNLSILTTSVLFILFWLTGSFFIGTGAG